jgi:outer membrane usher protein
MGRHRRGFTDQITIGGRFEAQPGTLGGGSTLNLRLPIGEIEGEAGTSLRDRWGLAGRIGYLYSGSTTTVGLSAMRAQDAYATIGQDAGRPHPALELSAFVSRTLRGGTTVGLQHSASRSIDVPAARRTSLTSSMRLVRNADVVTSLAYVKAERTDIQASVGITVSMGSRSAVAVSAIRDSRGVTGTVEVQRSLPVGTGFGYQLRTAQGDGASASGALQYQGKYGRYELRRDMAGSAAASPVVNLSGAVTMIGGGLYASRAIQNSFALVQVPGVSNVRAYASNQEIGRTNRKGNVLVPDLLPFYANQLTIADTDVPFDYLVSDVQASIAPPYRGGALVKFGVVRVQRATGILVLEVADGRSLTAGAEMRLAADGRAFESPVGSDGAFYFENLPPGTHTAEVIHAGGSCFADLTVPRSEAPTVDLGTGCAALARTGS